MALTTTQRNPRQLDQMAVGSYKDSAGTPGAMSITLGFDPRYIRVVNLTTRVEYEWYKDMAATHTLKTVANGTRTDDTGSAIVVTTSTNQTPNADDLSVVAGAAYQSTMEGATVPVAAFTFIAAGIAQNDQLHWEARG